MAQAQALARIKPVQIAAPAQRQPATALSRRQKAAVIVRLMLAEGSPIPLSALPEGMQTELAQQIGEMRLVDRSTLVAVVGEFLAELEQVGLTFPGGIEGALSLMDGHISPVAASRLRRLASSRENTDPWDRITALPPDRLRPILETESTEIAAIVLSKLPVAKAADLLGKLGGEKARRVAFAMSRTSDVNPGTVRRIGVSLLTQLDDVPPRAFDAGPVERVGAILNISPELTREDVLRGLDESDSDFAGQVRKAIFTFVHLPQRLDPRDVPKLVRGVEQPVLITALTAAAANPERAEAAEFLLANLSQRMAQGLREEMADRGVVKEKEAEAAMNAVIEAVRGLEAAGEIKLLREDEDD